MSFPTKFLDYNAQEFILKKTLSMGTLSIFIFTLLSIV